MLKFVAIAVAAGAFAAPAQAEVYSHTNMQTVRAGERAYLPECIDGNVPLTVTVSGAGVRSPKRHTTYLSWRTPTGLVTYSSGAWHNRTQQTVIVAERCI